MQLRTYQQSDAEDVLAMNQSNLDAVGPLDAERLDWLASMAEQFLVVEDDGGVAGFAITFGPRTGYDSANYRWFVERYDSFCYLDRVVVAAQHRRRGVGALIYDEAERHARTYGQMALEVYAEPPNTSSLAFHAGRGYAEVGRVAQDNGKVAAMFILPM